MMSPMRPTVKIDVDAQAQNSKAPSTKSQNLFLDWSIEFGEENNSAPHNVNGQDAVLVARQEIIDEVAND
jgi:hypothetical protein